MICIQFQRKDELDFLHLALQKYGAELIQVEIKTLQMIIHITEEKEKEGLSVIHNQLKKLILEKKQVDWCLEILETEFFYTDYDEQMQIIDILFSILTGKRKELAIDIEYTLDEEYIETSISEVLHPSATFSFDAFITFRLRTFIDKLSSYLEVAIDEYKMEQDYQAFIHYLRGFLSKREPQMKVIYVVNEDGFTFYDEKKQEIKRSELNRRIDRRLLSHHPVYVDSLTIAPLISIAPEAIYLYTNYPDSGLIRTLKNIFEEKIKIFPLHVLNENNMFHP